MLFLARCSEDEVRGIKGKLIIPSEEGKKDDRVLINLVVPNGDVGVFDRLTGKEYCVTFENTVIDAIPNGLPEAMNGRVFNKVSYDVFSKDPSGYSDSVPLLVELPSDFTDMRVLYDYCMNYPQVRFIGGKLLGIKGLRIGRSDEGKDNMSSVYEGMYDGFVETSLSDLSNIREIVKRVKTKVIEGSDKKVSKAKKEKVVKPNKKVESFKKLFTEEEVDF